MPSCTFRTPGMKDKDLKTGVNWALEGFKGCKFWQPPGSETAQRLASRDIKMKRRAVLSPVPPLSPPSCTPSHKSGSHTCTSLPPSLPPSIRPSIPAVSLRWLLLGQWMAKAEPANTRGTDTSAQSAATCGGKHMCPRAQELSLSLSSACFIECVRGEEKK